MDQWTCGFLETFFQGDFFFGPPLAWMAMAFQGKVRCAILLGGKKMADQMVSYFELHQLPWLALKHFILGAFRSAKKSPPATTIAMDLFLIFNRNFTYY